MLTAIAQAAIAAYETQGVTKAMIMTACGVEPKAVDAFLALDLDNLSAAEFSQIAEGAGITIKLGAAQSPDVAVEDGIDHP